MDGLKQNISPYTLQGIFTGKLQENLSGNSDVADFIIMAFP